MRLSRTNMPLASSDSVISQLTHAVFLDNLAPHLRAENPDHKLFCHSQPQNPPQLSKSGLAHVSAPQSPWKVLNAICKADFIDCSHGFRPARSPHGDRP